MGRLELNQLAATDVERRDALSRVLASDLFAHADRLKSFLTYIVDETLAGRGDAIRGKTIAMDVYGRDPISSGKPENVVRVDARRLRRRLVEYYANEGKNDPIRIWVDRGAYVPRMEIRKDTPSEKRVYFSRKTLIRGALLMLACGLVAVIFLGFQDSRAMQEKDSQFVLERQAFREKSAATLQAVNLAEQARAFLFPLLEVERQKIVAEMFRQAIRIDPDYFGGYAGLAQTLTTLSKLIPPGPEKDKTLAEAVRMVEIATTKNPTHSWTQSSAGWVAFGNGDFEGAFELSNRAAQLSPEDGYVLDFHALISVLTGHFEEARMASDPSRSRTLAKRRFANRNLYGVASIHLGEYEEAIASFRKAAEVGDPISALSLMYQAVAYQSLGNSERSYELLQEMAVAWPNFRPEIGLPALYQHQEHVDQILGPLRAAGWMPK